MVFSKYTIFDPSSITQKLLTLDQLRKLPRRETKSAAVLIPLLIISNVWSLLLTQRTNDVKDHKGQVSFPGGAVEKSDQSIIETALRESNEEIGLVSSNVKVLGSMPGFNSVSGYYIYPIVGQVLKQFDYRLEKQEVESVFTVPLYWLADSKNYAKKDYLRENGKNEKVLFYQEYDHHLIWGITARIIVDFIKLI